MEINGSYDESMFSKAKEFLSPPTQLDSFAPCLASYRKKPPLRLEKQGTRVRSASVGRDKKTELQARYWAFLFGNLQRAVNEIYETVERDRSSSSCKEAILVLDNYVRDFKALAEWFQVSVDYDNTPLPNRHRSSLAWEVRKSNPLPRVKIKTLASPKSLSGKSSPSYSGKNSPCPIIEEGSATPIKSLKTRDVKEYIHINHITLENLSNGEIVSHDLIVKSAAIPESEPLFVDENKVFAVNDLKLDQYTQTYLEDENLTLAEYLEKHRNVKSNTSTLEPLLTEVIAEKATDTKHSAIKVPKYSSVVSKNLPKNIKPVVKPQGILKRTTSFAQPKANPPIKSRGVPRNVENRLSARSKTMLEMNERGSILKNSKSRESVTSSSSTLKASTDKISKPHAMEGGWLTVKNRRRASLHWATRFSHPTGSTSLPSLSLLNEETKGEELSKTEEENKNRVIKTKITAGTKPTLNVKPTVVNPPTFLSRKQIPKQKIVQKTLDEAKRNINSAPIAGKLPVEVKRQKSDLTGLKLKTLRKEYLRSEKNRNVNGSPEKNKTPGETSDESEEKQKIDMNVQTAAASTVINKLYDDCVGSCKFEHSSSCDEEKEEFESDEDQKKQLEAQQERLEQEIRELENAEIDIDTETDETDCEVIIDLDENDTNPVEPVEDEISIEDRYESVLSDMSCVERLETLATLQAIHARYPGRAQQLHQKLSNPARVRPLAETLKKYQAKQTKALEKRQALQKEKAVKIQTLLARVEEVKSQKQTLIDQKRLRMEERLQRAAENRSQYLKDKVRKAHDEEEKLKEIAFIKNLEAKNKLLDFMESCREQQGRLLDLAQERLKKNEEKAAKEKEVEKRRLELEAQRQKRLEKMSETRREREKRVGKMQAQREQMRQKLAREKARDREERLLALDAQQLAKKEELQLKIQQKQQESARRHEENIEHIRQRALEMAIPTNRGVEEGAKFQTPTKYCSEKSKELVKSAKKKLKKIKQRMQLTATDYLAEMQTLPAHLKKESSVHKLLNMVMKGNCPLGVERPLGQLLRQMAKAQIADFQSMWLLDGLGIISEVIKKGMPENSEISKRAVVLSVQLYRNSCSSCPQLARHAILGNTITILFDALMISVQTPEEKSPLYPVELSTELILACTVALSPSNSLKHQANPKVLERLPDLISYTVATGLVDILAKRCLNIQESVENQQSVVLSLLATIGFLTKIAELCPKGPLDTTKFLSMVRSTELFGTISLLYSTIVPIGEIIPPRTISLAAATYNLLVTLANLDLNTFQEVISEEDLSLKFLDVVTILLKYCGPKCHEKGETQAVIIDLIATLGFFCANNKRNQDLLIFSEQSSIIVKSLTKLPKEFDMVIYPSLVTVIHENPEARDFISKDFDVTLLEEFKGSELAKKNRLVALLLNIPSQAAVPNLIKTRSDSFTTATTTTASSSLSSSTPSSS